MNSSSLIPTSFTSCSKTQYTLTIMVLLKRHYLSSPHSIKAPQTKPESTCLETMSTRKFHFVTMWMKMNGRLRNWTTAALVNSTSVQQQLPLRHMIYLSLEVDLRPRKMLDFIWLSKMRSPTNARWTNLETHMQSPCAKVMSLYLEVSLGSKGSALLRNMLLKKTNGSKWPSWRIRDTT